MMRNICLLVLTAFLTACASEDKSTENTATAESDARAKAYQEFADFYENFHQDSVFQMDHILFPLPGLPREADSSLISSGLFRWTPQTWIVQHPIDFQQSNFQQELIPVSKDLIIEKLVQPEYNLQIERRFSRLEDGWYLIYYAGLNNIPK